MARLRIALLHLAPRVGELEFNRRLLEAAVSTASELGADWVVTPELCLSGYQFAGRMGTDWIVAQPDAWMVGFRQLVATLRLTVFLSHAERDPVSDKLHNSVFVIGPDGGLLGTHRKVQVVPVAETWATAGDSIVPVHAPPLRVGILVCADAYTPRLAQLLQSQGAQILVSPAAWPPHPHGPQAMWEARSRETGLPLLVCNRAGRDDSLCFDDAESVVVKDGRRLMSFSARCSTVLMVDWDLETQAPVQTQFRQAAIDEQGIATIDWPAPEGPARAVRGRSPIGMRGTT
jgi:predicted amidohydrolase